MSTANEDHLLEILDAHGQEFLKVQSSPHAPQKLAKLESPSDSDSDEEEWGGIQAADDFEQDDDEFTSDLPQNVVHFAGPSTTKSNQSFSAAQKKAFLSSKVSKLSDFSSQPGRTSTQVDDEEERTNAQNDALLHRLVHTKLLSGSLNEELDLTSAQRKKALAGRVMELAGGARLGKGEKRVREGERNKASKHVREGLVRKQKERQAKHLEEAKNMGNYHPTIKKLFEDTKSTTKRRERGMGMGVGRFSGGMLKLGKDDISRVQNGAFSQGGNKGGRKRR
ncbi:hypothetical protein MIND_00699400 [Mycena indigotica]|uniref:Protein FAF1 n=1 Tax=Mycena indigotica TaxID=2126181 RepID=A0A8H6SM42_9AGAR|nr:uncharacterized protein MIND_00699400 [Mycena indigotica]KAF7301342.1 hypothetical protein MIND_00699400 [Mycena indigotica]